MRKLLPPGFKYPAERQFYAEYIFYALIISMLLLLPR